MANFQKYFMPIKYLKKRMLRFDPHNPLDKDNATVNSIQGDTLDLIEYFQEAIDLGLINIDGTPSIPTSTLSYYNAGYDFWVFAEEGVTVDSTSAGVYTLSIPEGIEIVSAYKLLTNETTELDSSGSILITLNYNTSDFHTSKQDARYPLVSFIWSNNQQYLPSATGDPTAIGITSTLGEPSFGSSLITLTNVSGAVDPLELGLKLTF